MCGSEAARNLRVAEVKQMVLRISDQVKSEQRDVLVANDPLLGVKCESSRSKDLLQRSLRHGFRESIGDVVIAADEADVGDRFITETFTRGRNV